MWEKIVPDFNFDPDVSYFDIVVPTINTIRFSRLLNYQLRIRKPVFVTGQTGTGKSLITTDALNQLALSGESLPVMITFSARTNSENA